MNKNRYLVQISFKTTRTCIFAKLWDIVEEVKTLYEAKSYKELIDDTVDKAQVVDTVTNQVVERWK